MTTAILLMDHGSRVAAANQALYAIADMLRWWASTWPPWPAGRAAPALTLCRSSG
jgi:hypothetical protein